MMKELRPAIVMLLGLTVITGLIYPLGMTGLGQFLFPYQANGSLVEKDGKVIGSELLGQAFADEQYFHGRPSATATAYDAANSSGSNLGPTSQALIDRVTEDAAKLKLENPSAAVPVDLATTSASGLDPHITPAGALFQIPRVAKARGLSEGDLRGLVDATTEERFLGFIGERRVNVLKLNITLDELWPMQ